MQIRNLLDGEFRFREVPGWIVKFGKQRKDLRDCRFPSSGFFVYRLFQICETLLERSTMPGHTCSGSSVGWLPRFFRVNFLGAGRGVPKEGSTRFCVTAALTTIGSRDFGSGTSVMEVLVFSWAEARSRLVGTRVLGDFLEGFLFGVSDGFGGILIVGFLVQRPEFSARSLTKDREKQVTELSDILSLQLA